MNETIQALQTLLTSTYCPMMRVTLIIIIYILEYSSINSFQKSVYNIQIKQCEIYYPNNKILDHW